MTVWRQAAEIGEPRTEPPPAPRFDEELLANDYVPIPCMLHPEQVTEYPQCDRDVLPGLLRHRVEQWDAQHDEQYNYALSSAPGTKVGGYPLWIQDPFEPVCECGRTMEHLLTIATDEFGTKGRWLPLEDRDNPAIVGPHTIIDRDAWAPHGLMLGDVGSLYLFTCTTCPHRPLAGTEQST
ncbi:hypothetical protein [Actinopolymorpha sp. B9G3]|uniref:hypothetical protein n=1 Tax=Actinopolymorpha sp. B9G3 TaxID=3158970 RepID=UPI0032D8F61E